MAAVTICSDFGAQKNKVWHCFQCFPIYLPWSDGTRCHDLRLLAPKILHGNPPFSNHWPGSFPSSQYPAAEVVNFGTWFLFSFPISLIMLVVSWFWMHWLFLGCKWVLGLWEQGSPIPPGPWPKPWGWHLTGSCQVTIKDAQKRRQWSRRGLRHHVF